MTLLMHRLGAFLIEEVYQGKGIYFTLGYMTPVEFEAAWKEDEVRVLLLGTVGNVSSFMGPLHFSEPFVIGQIRNGSCPGKGMWGCTVAEGTDTLYVSHK